MLMEHVLAPSKRPKEHQGEENGEPQKRKGHKDHKPVQQRSSSTVNPQLQT